MECTIDIKLIKNIVDRLDSSIAGEESNPAYRAAVVLLAAVSVGAVVDKLVTLTGYESSFVNDIFQRMCLAGLWSATRVRIDHWLAEDEDTIQPAVFWSDVLVAEGLLIAQPVGPTQIWYRAVEVNSDPRSDRKTPRRLLQ